MTNKKSKTLTPTAESIVKQANKWADSDEENAAIVILRDKATDTTHACVSCHDDLSIVEMLVGHMLHDDFFKNAVSLANNIIENHRGEIEDYIKQRQSQS